jgi:hypothetical protein
LRKGLGLFDLGRSQTHARPLVSGLSALEMGTAQACGCQQDPPARSDRAIGHFGLVGIHLCEFDLRAGQALFGSGQQPPDGLRSAAFGSVTAIAQSVFVQDAEIELRRGIASFGRFKQALFHTNSLLNIQDEGRGSAAMKERHMPSRRPCRRAMPACPSCP